MASTKSQMNCPRHFFLLWVWTEPKATDLYLTSHFPAPELRWMPAAWSQAPDTHLPISSSGCWLRVAFVTALGNMNWSNFHLCWSCRISSDLGTSSSSARLCFKGFHLAASIQVCHCQENISEHGLQLLLLWTEHYVFFVCVSVIQGKCYSFTGIILLSSQFPIAFHPSLHWRFILLTKLFLFLKIYSRSFAILLWNTECFIFFSKMRSKHP